MREAFLAALVADVLGPRNGIREMITESPLSEYVTGVLSPITQVAPRDIEASAELPTEEYVLETEDTEGTDDAGDVTPFAPVLNPQSRPFSMGVSFVVESEVANPTIDVCVSWARYARIGEGPQTHWIRQPRVAVMPGIRAAASSFWLDAGGQQVPHRSAQAEISLHVTARAVPQNGLLVTLHIVNRVPVAADDHPHAELHIYQPQLRVRCPEETRIAAGVGRAQEREEERVLNYLYRSRPVLARGHLTSAVWASIDPERARGDTELDVPGAAEQPPFRWTDGEMLPLDQRAHFTVPDVRTEYVPLVSVPMPELGVRPGYGAGSELRADTLAELWEADALAAALSPLLDGYRTWIRQRRDEIAGVQPRDEIGHGLMDDCDRAANRMESGIRTLSTNEDARLAFCFAMKAMATQHSWPNATSPLVWYPFQIAFILSVLTSIVDPQTDDRETCDVLWVPTGGGKTEAYLALLAFTIGYRRRRARRANDRRTNSTGAGVSVLSRYTLRLLTIQQFRRTLKLITACDLLRVDGFDRGAPVGWRPARYQSNEQLLWGASRFSVGLWVGAGVTPNRLAESWVDRRPMPGALGILAGQDGEGEPAQVLRCPACDAVLSIPQAPVEGVDRGERVPATGYTLHWTVKGAVNALSRARGLVQDDLSIAEINYEPLDEPNFGVITATLIGAPMITARMADLFWSQIAALLGAVQLVCARAARPGYFLRRYRGRQDPFDFDVICPSPRCRLRHSWFEGAPAGFVHDCGAQATAPPGRVDRIPEFHDLRLAHVIDAFRERNSHYAANRVPIPAYTVDDQVYHRCPSVVIATADKLARPAFEPRAAALFGNVDRHHCIHGFYREYLHAASNRGDQHPTPAGRAGRENWVSITPFDPPDLILQDELHLIEGPLGSLVGLYETAVDALCLNQRRPVKYIASTATVRQAADQVQAVFNRAVAMFPPPGLTADDSFFVHLPQRHQLDDRFAGRVYAGLCAPGRGPLTPLLRIWARLLQTAFQHSRHARIDPFWTLAGYFNAIRELAGARALYRQDIPERLELIARLDAVAGIGPRPLPEDRSQELSGRMDSTQLPVVLDLLNEARTNANGSQDALFTTSMFGTGVDIPRLSLMVVNGQPKTTSSYIQATGRVGRRSGALVPTFLRSTRPRDLNHYEFFCGYHVQLHRFVEPVTVMPFAPGVLDRALGPVGVFLLRNRRGTRVRWSEEGRASQMAQFRGNDPDVAGIPAELEQRASTQPAPRRPAPLSVMQEANSALDDWHAVANRNPVALRYVEYADPPTLAVVLGDARHQHRGLDVAYENVPQSLRDIEETCGFRT